MIVSAQIDGSGGGAKPGGTWADDGFSLVEVVVVTAIVSVISVSVVLGLRTGQGNSPAAKMDAFAKALRYVQAEALYTNRSFALSLAETGWEVLVFSDQQQSWERRKPRELHATGTWGEARRFLLRLEGRDVVLKAGFDDTPQPDVFLLPSGETTAFHIAIEQGDGRRASCSLQNYGELQCLRGG